MQRVLRWAVPVDDQWHDIGAGYVVETSARQSISRPGDLVEIWTLEDTPDDGPVDVPMRSVIVIGTGHPVPENTEHVGTAIVPALQLVPSALAGQRDRIESIGGLVWHVFAKYDPAAERAALAEEGRRLASIREDLIASGVDPTELPAPLHPDPLPTVAGETVHGRTRDAAVRTLEDEATSLAYWLAHELGEHVDDQDGETLTQTVRRLLAVKLAPATAPVVPIRDWDDMQVGDVVVQNPALIDEDITHDMAGRNNGSDFLVRRPGQAEAHPDRQIGGFRAGQTVRIDSVNLDDYQGMDATVATLDHDHGWRLWIITGIDRFDPAGVPLYVSPDDIEPRDS